MRLKIILFFNCLYWWHFVHSQPIQDENNDEWINQSDSNEARASRFGWSGVLDSPECPGDALKLSPGEATRIVSHKSYGQQDYPENYLCRWLVFPANNCQLSMVCNVATPAAANESSRDFGTSCSSSNSDYLRIVGYGGLVDSKYCGTERFSVVVDGKTPLALSFKSHPKPTQDSSRHLSDILNFFGFNCKLECKSNTSTSTEITTTAETQLTESNLKIVSQAANPDFIVLPQGVTKEPNPGESTTTTVKTSTVNLINEEEEERSCSCGGGRQGRIVCPITQNCTAQIGSVPWQVGLVSRNTYRPWCGGSLISDRYVLTAAHCVFRKDMGDIQVILGDYDWTTLDEVDDSIKVDLIDIIIHPRFGERATFDHDFALLKLKHPIQWSDNAGINPVCLPKTRHAFISSGVKGWASGWGVLNPDNRKVQAEKLQIVSVFTMGNRDCERFYDDNGSVTDTMICAKSFLGGDACFGDSGGPFVNDDNELIGVVSWGKSCAKPYWPGVYSRVSSAIEWIYDHTQDSNFCEKPDRRPRRINDKRADLKSF